MKETEARRSPGKVEQIRQDLLDHFKDAEFGSVKYQAASDYFDINRHRYQLRDERNNVISAGEDQSEKLYWESEMRIRETQIALLEREIEKNQSRIPGYSLSYWYLWNALEDLAVAANKEADEKYPTDKEGRKAYGEKVFNQVYSEINELLFARQEVE